LKAIDLLILSQVEEFVRNGCDCYVTDEQFMDLTGAKKDAVRKSLQRLEDKKIIARDTSTVTGHGKANRRRTLRLLGEYRNVALPVKNCNTEKSLEAIPENYRCNTEKPQIKEKENISEEISYNKNHYVCLEETSSSKHISPSRVKRYY
jgi:transcription initiation factor IIE alpha subunit